MSVFASKNANDVIPFDSIFVFNDVLLLDADRLTETKNKTIV